MKKSIIFLGIILIITWGGFAQQQTADGGYIIGGSSHSYTTGYTGLPDMIVYKLDGAGNVEWSDHYGGVMLDVCSKVIQTSDGGYLILGISQSFSFPAISVLIYKLDGSGSILWQKVHLEPMSDQFGVDVKETGDGGFIVAGGVYDSYFQSEFLVYRLAADGSSLWRRTYGGMGYEIARAVSTTTDGGFLVAGMTTSYTHGVEDMLVYKLNAAGSKQWRKNYGGFYQEAANVCLETAGGYMLAGATGTYVHGMPGFIFGDLDYLVYNLNADGQKLWRKNYGGVEPDICNDIRTTDDGGYILGGSTSSYVHGMGGGWPMGDWDFLLYKIDQAGKKQWRKNYGGTDLENAVAAFQTTDGGYLVFGETRSYTHGSGDLDLLVYKVDRFGNKQWRRNYGGDDDEMAFGF